MDFPKTQQDWRHDYINKKAVEHDKREMRISIIFVAILAVIIVAIFLIREARAVDYDNYFSITTTAGQATSFDSADANRTKYLAIRFTPGTSGYICNVNAKIGRLDYSTTTLTLSIYSEPTGNPFTGSFMTSVDVSDVYVPYTGLGAPTQYVTFNLPTCYFLQNTKTYDFIYGGSGTKAGSLHYGIAWRTSDQTTYTTDYYYVPSGGWTVQTAKEYDLSINGIRTSELDVASTSTNMGVCDFADNSIEQASCDTLAYLFVPSNQSLVQWQDQLVEIQYKAPHGYLFLLSDEFASATSAIDTTTHLKIDVNVPGHSELATATLDVTQAYNDAPAEVRDFGYLWLKRMLWASFVFYLVWRAINFFKPLPS